MFKLTPKEQKLVILLACLLVLGFVLRFTLPERNQEISIARDNYPVNENNKDASGGMEDTIVEKEMIIVHVAGAVVEPGVYYLEKGSRVFQAIEKAGGPLEEADLERINLAQPLMDGQQVYIPAFLPAGEEAQLAGAVTFRSEAYLNQSRKININTASKAELETLPGIGAVKAQNIIKYREEHGYFQRIEDITRVNGIGEKTFENIKDLITVY